MKTMMRTLLIAVIVLGLLGGAGYWVVQELAAKDGDKISAIAEELEQQDSNRVEAETVNTDEAGEQMANGMDEEELQIYLHQMTHQKVTADKKFGAVEMSEANIENLLKIVQANSGVYEHSDFYEETLNAWADGDFSNAVTVHNTIWKWHNGNVGRATGLMSPEQEAEYVKKHFR